MPVSPRLTPGGRKRRQPWRFRRMYQASKVAAEKTVCIRQCSLPIMSAIDCRGRIRIFKSVTRLHNHKPSGCAKVRRVVLSTHRGRNGTWSELTSPNQQDHTDL